MIVLLNWIFVALVQSFERKAKSSTVVKQKLCSSKQRTDIIENDDKAPILEYRRGMTWYLRMKREKKNKFSNCDGDNDQEDIIGPGPLSCINSTLSGDRMRLQVFLSVAGTREKHEQVQ